MASVERARCTLTAGARIHVFALPRCIKVTRSPRLRVLGSRKTYIRCTAAFVSHDAYQCGYCTSGQIMSAVAMLKEPCGAEDAEVKEFMSGNICRCGAYQNIVAAIQSVRQGTVKEKQA